MEKTLFSVAQLTSLGYYVVFGPQDVRRYNDLVVEKVAVMKGKV